MSKKAALKKLIKECLREVLLEEEILTKAISEAVSNTGKHVVTETKTTNVDAEKENDEARQKINEVKRKLLSSINADAYGGVDLFEGTTPMRAETNTKGPMRNIDPNDSGVDISKLPGANVWKHLIK